MNFLNLVKGDISGALAGTPAGSIRDAIMNRQQAAPTGDAGVRQTSDAMTGVGQMSQEELQRLNAAARAQGYPSYEAMRLRQMQQQGGGLGAVSDRERSLVDRVGDAWNNAMAWHPAKTLKYVADLLQGANEGNQGQ